MLRGYTERLVKLMRWWRYDHERGVWKHLRHDDVSVNTELLVILLMHTIAAADELEREEVELDAR